jgi:hypothetical protein
MSSSRPLQPWQLQYTLRLCTTAFVAIAKRDSAAIDVVSRRLT